MPQKRLKAPRTSFLLERKNLAKIVLLIFAIFLLIYGGYILFGKKSAEKTIVPEEPENLIYVAHYTTFSGNGWINAASTTMYQDLSESAFMFPPKIEWRKTEAPVSGAAGQSVKLVGKVVKAGDVYKGVVYKINGEAIFDETNTPLISKYEGVISFGGDEKNFIAVYGAYEGRAVQVKNGNITDISEFFPIRVMAGGFEPEILKTTLGGETIWYVWSKTGYPAKLVKLFENKTSNIQGAVDLSPKLGFLPGDLRQARFNAKEPIIGKDFTRLTARVLSAGIEEFYEFTDFGFDKSQERMIVSQNINQYALPVFRAELSPIYLSPAGAEINFEISNDGKVWKKAVFGQRIIFPDSDKQFLYWRAAFRPDKDMFISPFSTGVKVEYTVIPS